MSKRDANPPRHGTLTAQRHGDRSNLAPGERDRMMAEFNAAMTAKRKARKGKLVDDYFAPPNPTQK